MLEFYNTHDDLPAPRVHRLGLPDEFIEHGPQAHWRDCFNLSTEGIVREVKAHFTDLYADRAPRKIAAGARKD